MKKIFLLLLVFLSFTNDLLSQDSLYLLTQQFSDSLTFNGSLIVQNHDETVFNYNNGYANFEYSIPITDKSKFRVASISKAFVSYAFYKLASDSILKLTSSIRTYIPELDQRFEDVTLDEIITHRSGIIRDLKLLSQKNTLEYVSPAKLIEMVNQTDLMFEPGSSYAYSNTGYTLLAIAITKIKNTSLQNALEEIVFNKLSMHDTKHENSWDIIQDMSQGYYRISESHYKAKYEDKSWVFGAGSFYSTGYDLLRFSNEVLEGSLLTKEWHQAYLKDAGGFQTSSGWTTWSYSSKLDMHPKNGRVISTGGSSPGFKSSLTIFLEHKVIVVSLANVTPIDLNIIMNKTGNLALGFGREEVYKPQLEKILTTIFNGNINQAHKEYLKLNILQPNNESIKPHNLNNLGYILLELNRYEDAKHIFSFGIKLFPENSNLYDSLAETYMLNNEFKKSIEFYTKSLEMDPNNEGARQMLKTLEKKISETRKLASILIVLIVSLTLFTIYHFRILIFPSHYFSFNYEIGFMEIFSEQKIPELELDRIANSLSSIEHIFKQSSTKNIRAFIFYSEKNFANTTKKVFFYEQVQGVQITHLRMSFINLSFVEHIRSNYKGKFRYSLMDGEFSHVLVHEILHQLIYDYVGSKNYKSLPKWINEGLCEYYSSLEKRTEDKNYSLSKSMKEYLISKPERIENSKYEYIKFRHEIEFLLDVKKLSVNELLLNPEHFVESIIESEIIAYLKL